MAGTPTVYVICDQNCKFEGMTKEQIFTAITQAVEGGEIKDVDTGFITTIKTINGTPLKFFVGEQAEYFALTPEERENLFAIITNDTTKEGLFSAVEALQTNYSELFNGLFDGSFVVKKASEAATSEKATGDRYGNDITRSYLSNNTTVYGFAGSPRSGFEIVGRKLEKGGQLYLAYYTFTTKKYCFGLIFWDGETTTYSPVCVIDGKRYCVKIEYDRDRGDGENVVGLAKLVKFSDTWQEEICDMSGSVLLRLNCFNYIPAVTE